MNLEIFKYIENVIDYKPQGAFVIVLPSGISSKKQLLDAYYKKLMFPEYFGFNWDALFDCLTDLHWIKTTRIAVVHQDLPAIKPDELRKYLLLIRDAISSWKRSDDHQLEMVFPKKNRFEMARYFPR